MEDIKRIGSYPAIVARDPWYKLDEIEDMEEFDIEEIRKELIADNEMGIGLRNLDDPTKCKLVFSNYGRERSMKAFARRYEDNKYFVIL